MPSLTNFGYYGVDVVFKFDQDFLLFENGKLERASGTMNKLIILIPASLLHITITLETIRKLTQYIKPMLLILVTQNDHSITH